MAQKEQGVGERRPFDRPLFIGVLLLAAFGVVMVYSASAVTGLQEKHDASYFLVRQIVYTVLGVVAMLVVSRIDYRIYMKPWFAWGFLGASFLGLLLCHTPIGMTINGASRWIKAGPVTIQPAERTLRGRRVPGSAAGREYLIIFIISVICNKSPLNITIFSIVNIKYTYYTNSMISQKSKH